MGPRDDVIMTWLVPVELRPRRVRRVWLVLLDVGAAALVGFALLVTLHAARGQGGFAGSYIITFVGHPLMYAAWMMIARHALACDEIVSLRVERALKRFGWPRRSILELGRVVTAGVLPHRQGRGRRELVFLMIDGMTWRSVLPPCLEDDVMDGLLARMRLPVPLQKGDEPMQPVEHFARRPLFAWPRVLGMGSAGYATEAAWSLCALGLTAALLIAGTCVYGPYAALPSGAVAMAIAVGAYTLGYMTPRVRLYPSGLQVSEVRVPWQRVKDVGIERDETSGARTLVVAYDLCGIDAVRRMRLHWRFDEEGFTRAVETARGRETGERQRV